MSSRSMDEAHFESYRDEYLLRRYLRSQCADDKEFSLVCEAVFKYATSEARSALLGKRSDFDAALSVFRAFNSRTGIDERFNPCEFFGACLSDSLVLNVFGKIANNLGKSWSESFNAISLAYKSWMKLEQYKFFHYLYSYSVLDATCTFLMEAGDDSPMLPLFWQLWLNLLNLNISKLMSDDDKYVGLEGRLDYTPIRPSLRSILDNVLHDMRSVLWKSQFNRVLFDGLLNDDVFLSIDKVECEDVSGEKFLKYAESFFSGQHGVMFELITDIGKVLFNDVEKLKNAQEQMADCCLCGWLNKMTEECEVTKYDHSWSMLEDDFNFYIVLLREGIGAYLQRGMTSKNFEDFINTDKLLRICGITFNVNGKPYSRLIAQDDFVKVSSRVGEDCVVSFRIHNGTYNLYDYYKTLAICDAAEYIGKKASPSEDLYDEYYYDLNEIDDIMDHYARIFR
ncbi:MAG: hypothetical protein E7015_02120 [Alphaproteobacteria bacterium]|nr:hypothetical protein [Alphaproteobacteria bacterium]